MRSLVYFAVVYMITSLPFALVIGRIIYFGGQVSLPIGDEFQEIEMLKSKFADKSKNREERMPGWPMDGVPVKRQVGMIYWYSWGKHTFDIRVMRRVLGLPEEHPADHWFTAKQRDPCGSFHAVMLQLEQALGKRSFQDAMAAHDRAQDEASEAELAAFRERKAKAATTPTAASTSARDECPF